MGLMREAIGGKHLYADDTDFTDLGDTQAPNTAQRRPGISRPPLRMRLLFGTRMKLPLDGLERLEYRLRFQVHCILQFGEDRCDILGSNGNAL